jgi:hypothetical protein
MKKTSIFLLCMVVFGGTILFTSGSLNKYGIRDRGLPSLVQGNWQVLQTRNEPTQEPWFWSMSPFFFSDRYYNMEDNPENPTWEYSSLKITKVEEVTSGKTWRCTLLTEEADDMSMLPDYYHRWSLWYGELPLELTTYLETEGTNALKAKIGGRPYIVAIIYSKVDDRYTTPTGFLGAFSKNLGDLTIDATYKLRPAAASYIIVRD